MDHANMFQAKCQHPKLQQLMSHIMHYCITELVHLGNVLFHINLMFNELVAFIYLTWSSRLNVVHHCEVRPRLQFFITDDETQ